MVTIAEMNHRVWHNFSRAGEVVNENHQEHHKAAQSIYRLDSVQYNAWLVGGCSLGHYLQCSVFPAALAILIISRAAKPGEAANSQPRAISTKSKHLTAQEVARLQFYEHIVRPVLICGGVRAACNFSGQPLSSLAQ